MEYRCVWICDLVAHHYKIWSEYGYGKDRMVVIIILNFLRDVVFNPDFARLQNSEGFADTAVIYLKSDLFRIVQTVDFNQIANIFVSPKDARGRFQGQAG